MKYNRGLIRYVIILFDHDMVCFWSALLTGNENFHSVVTRSDI